MPRKITFKYSAFSNITYKRDVEVDVEDEFGPYFDPSADENQDEIWKLGRTLLLEDVDIDWEITSP
jgi:hypothetical protein